MTKQYHRLKTWPEYYNAIIRGDKSFEVRRNDRGFETGDVVELMEWNPATKQYTGRSTTFEIGFIIDSDFGLQSGFCAFSLKR